MKRPLGFAIVIARSHNSKVLYFSVFVKAYFAIKMNSTKRGFLNMINGHLENRQISELKVQFFTMAGRAVDIDDVIRKNLRRIIEERGLKQNHVARKIGVAPSQISDILSGLKNMGKDMMTRLCTELSIDPWEFYVTEKSPIVKNPREQQRLYIFREEERLGIAEEIARYEEYQIYRAKVKQGGGAGSREERLEQIGQVLSKYVPQATMEQMVQKVPRLAPILKKKKREQKKKVG